MDFFKKLQNYPENAKKIILWVAVVVIGLALSVVYIFYVQRKMVDFQEKGFMEGAGLPAIDVQPLRLDIQNFLIDNLASADKEM